VASSAAVSAPPEPPTIVSALANRTFGLWFPFFRLIATRVPPHFIARLAEATVERVIWERESVREAICENFSRVLGLPKTDRRVEEAGREMVSRHSRLWIDLLRYSGLGAVDPAGLLARRTGDEMLSEAQRAGTGGILLTAHVGNFELGGLFLRELGLSVSAVYVPDPSPAVEAHREEARQKLGVTGLPMTSSPFAFLPILRALKEGRFVAIQGDRDVSGTGRTFTLFGEPTPLPIGPFQLAAQSGAPLFPVFVLQCDDGRYETIVHPPLRVRPARPGKKRDGPVVEAAERFVEILTETIRRHPTQWFQFTRFWEVSPDLKAQLEKRVPPGGAGLRRTAA